MAAASYTTDLATIDLCESGGLTWAEPTASGWTLGAAPAVDTENYIQGSAAISKAFNATGVGGMMVNFTTGITIPTDGAFFGWIYWASPQTLDTDANGGLRMMAGTSLAAFKSWDVGGKDSYAYGGWVNNAVNTTVAADDTVGSVTTLQYFGVAYSNTNAITKGSPGLCDAFRYGRGEARMNGGDLANGYATFNGFAAVNDASTARWGLIQSNNGSYLVKGLVVFGYTSAVDFRDSNKALFIQNTAKVTANFNTFEVRQAGSRVDLVSITITALGTVSRGRWVTTDNATVNLTSCVFTDMGVFGFASGTTVLNTTLRRCGIITQNGATITGCTIDAARDTKALVASAINLVTNTIFVSKGTGYGVEGFSAAGDYTLTGLTFTGFAASNGTTGNEAIHVLATSGVVNLNISGGSPTPSIHTAGATVNIISGSVNAVVTVKNTSGVAIENANVLVLAATGGSLPYNVTVTISNSGTTATVTHTAHGMATNDKVFISGASLQANNGVFAITYIGVNSYSYTMTSTPGSSPTGTIKATYVALAGFTNINGVISMSRVFSSNQPVIGRVRKATGTPLYKTGDIVDTISSTAGMNNTVLLIKDE